jgi:hypothetical protein
LSRAWRLVLPALLGGLLAGVWIGSRCERAHERRMRKMGPSPERVVKMLRRELKLRDDQAEPIRAIIAGKTASFDAVRRDGEARMEALRAEIDRDIAPLLDDAQKLKLGEMRARRMQRAKESSPAVAK